MEIDDDDSMSEGNIARAVEKETQQVEVYPMEISITESDIQVEVLLGLPELDDNPWYPFSDAYDFKAARFFLTSDNFDVAIRQFYNEGLARPPDSYNPITPRMTSAESFKRRLELMDKVMSSSKWNCGEVLYPRDRKTTKFYYRDIATLIRHIIRQPYVAEHLVFLPQKDYDSDGNRLFSGLHTAEWWWEEQVHMHPLYH